MPSNIGRYECKGIRTFIFLFQVQDSVQVQNQFRNVQVLDVPTAAVRKLVILSAETLAEGTRKMDSEEQLTGLKEVTELQDLVITLHLQTS